MHEHKIIVRFLAEMGGTLLFYILVLVISIKAGRSMPEGIERTLVLGSPIVPFLLMGVAVLRQIRRLDEYMRLLALENIAIAVGVTAGWTFTYGFLENAGFPRLSMFTVWPIMGMVWAVVAIVRCRAHR